MLAVACPSSWSRQTSAGTGGKRLPASSSFKERLNRYKHPARLTAVYAVGQAARSTCLRACSQLSFKLVICKNSISLKVDRTDRDNEPQACRLAITPLVFCLRLDVHGSTNKIKCGKQVHHVYCLNISNEIKITSFSSKKKGHPRSPPR